METLTRRAVVAGASGFVGRHIVGALRADGYDVIRIGRHEQVRWDDQAAVDAAVEGADLILNLAGRTVNCRYTDRNRDEILRSRIDTTAALHTALSRATTPARVWMNASTATIYRHATDRPNTESTGELGTGFSVDVAREWERVFFEGELPATRRVALRMAIVVGDGPATRMLLTLARIGLGGPQYDGWTPPHRRYRGIGSAPTGGRAPWYRTRGRQRFSWIHIDDVIGAIRFLDQSADLSGPVNLAAPTPTDNRTLMRTLRRVVGAPFGLPSMRWMLELAMWVLRTEPELVLKSRWVLPERLTEAGYRFVRTDLEHALREVTASGRIRRRPGPRTPSARS